MVLFEPKCTTHYYEPSELHQKAAGVTGLEITEHPNGGIRFFIRIGDGSHTACHTACGNSISDAKKGMWNRLQQILPKEAREDVCVRNAFESKEEETDKLSAGTIVQESEKRQELEQKLKEMTDRKEHHKKRKHLYRKHAEELRNQNEELLNNRLFDTDDEDDEAPKKPKPST
jgi:hypothetical protein